MLGCLSYWNSISDTVNKKKIIKFSVHTKMFNIIVFNQQK